MAPVRRPRASRLDALVLRRRGHAIITRAASDRRGAGMHYRQAINGKPALVQQVQRAQT